MKTIGMCVTSKRPPKPSDEDLSNIPDSVRVWMEYHCERSEQIWRDNYQLETTLRQIAADGYGLQGIIEDYPDTNAYNYHAMKYWHSQCESKRRIAQNELNRWYNTGVVKDE